MQCSESVWIVWLTINLNTFGIVLEGRLARCGQRHSCFRPKCKQSNGTASLLCPSLSRAMAIGWQVHCGSILSKDHGLLAQAIEDVKWQIDGTEVIESEKVVARRGEHVIDQQAITVANQQACMILCALEAASEFQRFRAGCLLYSIHRCPISISSQVRRSVVALHTLTGAHFLWFAGSLAQATRTGTLSRWAWWSGHVVYIHTYIHIYDFTKFVRVYVKYLQLGKR
jgi:hypothetical protein